MKESTSMSLPAIVIGAGPVGLAAAVHLIARGHAVLIFEAGNRIAANLDTYRHVRLFSRWRHNVDPAAVQLLEAAGWTHPAPDAFPTAGEIIDHYLHDLAALEPLAPHIRLAHRVTDIARRGCSKVTSHGRAGQPFVVRVETPEGVREFDACAVFDASGTWTHPNPIGSNGLPAMGEQDMSGAIAYGMPDIRGAASAQYANQSVLVVGAGHSAVGSLLALGELAEEAPATRIEWAIRHTDASRIFGKPPESGAPSERVKLGLRLQALHDAGTIRLNGGFHVSSIAHSDGKLQVIGRTKGNGVARNIAVDRIICATGSRPDWNMTRELRLRHDEMLECTNALAQLIDPNIHSCGLPRALTVDDLAHPEEGYFCLGAKSYGRAPNFLMVTGYEQVRIAVEAFCNGQNTI